MQKLLSRIKFSLVLGALGVFSTFLFASCNNISHTTTSMRSLSSPDCRIIRHTMGETCVPKKPERLATIFHVTLGNTLLLGLEPIGSSIVEVEEQFPEYLENKTGTIEPLGTQDQPSLEALAKLKPDLILSWDLAQADYSLLSHIAPTVLIPWQGSVIWKEYFELIAEALGKEAEAEQAWKHYYQRVNELKVALGDQYKNKTVSVVFPYFPSGFFLSANNSFIGSILEDIGLERPESQNIGTARGDIFINSLENLEMIDGDILFVATSKEDENFREILDSPLAKSLKAVKSRQVYYVNSLTWNGSNLLAADTVIDDLYKYLVNTP